MLRDGEAEVSKNGIVASKRLIQQYDIANSSAVTEDCGRLTSVILQSQPRLPHLRAKK